ncbi:MAG: hypothetical protein KAW92_10365 [Candidatus Cloacimonetes bacterium]|nr:hypothetical protein [Candidatus Cloacimonadota bacterium]
MKAKKQGILGKIGKGKQREAGKLYGERHPKQEVLPKNGKSYSHNTQEIIAEELGRSK